MSANSAVTYYVLISLLRHDLWSIPFWDPDEGGCPTVVRAGTTFSRQDHIETRLELLREDDDHLRDGQQEGQLPAVRAEIERQALHYDLAVHHIMHTQAWRAGARIDTLRTLCYYVLRVTPGIGNVFLVKLKKKAPKSAPRSTPKPHSSHTSPKMQTPTTTVIEAQLQALIDQELLLQWLKQKMFPEEIDKIEKYIDGLPDMIHGSVKALKTKTMQEAIECTTELMDEKTYAYAERQAERKRKYDDLSKNNQNQQNKRQNTGQAYTAGNSDSKSYVGSRPLCSKCNYNHEGPCPPRCNNYKRVGHLTKDCRSRPANANNNNRNNNNNNQKGNCCYDCGAQCHFRRNCPKLKNNDRGNQAGNDRAPAKVYVVGNAGANPDNVVAGTFLLNNRYAYILFDTGADRSFMSTSFRFQIDITPSTLDYYYDVELADGRIIGLNTILKGCTLNFLNHQFNINLMPVEMGSFDVIIGMDWLSKYSAVIDCAKKIVRIPWRNKTLIIHGDGSTQGDVTRLNIISCTKTQKYMEKGFPIFLAHVTAKEVEGKSEMKRLEDVSIVQDFPEVFPEDLS
ncbi:putative reverse transcriptase domain-containing protein, partial [Tanacetum coccineum]